MGLGIYIYMGYPEMSAVCEYKYNMQKSRFSPKRSSARTS